MSSFFNTISNIDSCAPVTPSDITVCIAVRLTDINPWVIERLRWLGNNYEPSPKFLILDFGSPEPYATEIQKTCEHIGAEYHHINDSGEFSLAIARNTAFEKVATDLIFFTDIDFVYEKPFYKRLAEVCNRFEISRYPLRCFSMPAYHVSQNESGLYKSLPSTERDRLISEWCLAGAQTEFGTIFEFVAPYSNNLLCHRNLFSMTGGYCTEFRGHGSEDFEFFIRLAIVASHIPMPTHLDKDLHSPLNESFFKVKEYAGFRRLLELFTYPSESIGLKSFHIWHQRPWENGYWTAKKDWNRDRFNKVVLQYIKNNKNILELDFLSRPQKALCIFEDEKQWRYFLPLRLAGYRLFFIDINNSSFNEVVKRVETNKFNRIFFCCADFKRHHGYNSIIELARRMDVPVYFAEFGAIPYSICFSDKIVSSDLYGQKASIIENREINNSEAHEFVGCKTEQYNNISIENLVLDGQKISCGMGLSRYPFSWRSYVSGHLTLAPDNAENRAQLFGIERKSSLRRKLRKLIRSPRQFIRDALMKRLL